MPAKAGVEAGRSRGPQVGQVGSGESPEGDSGRVSPGGVLSEGLLEAAKEADLWAHRALLSARDLHCRGLPPSEGPSGNPPAEPAAGLAAAREDLRRASELLRSARRALREAAQHHSSAEPKPRSKEGGDR